MSPFTLHRLSWSHPHQRTCTILHTHLTRFPDHWYSSTRVLNERPRGHDFIKFVCLLYFTLFTGIESILPGMSDLGVMINIKFEYTMQREGKEEPEDMSSPQVHESMPCSDAVWFLTQPYNSMKSAVRGCALYCLMLGKQPRLPVVLLPMICVNTCLRWVLAYVEEVQECFKEGCNEASHQPNNERDRQRGNYKFASTVQLRLGDVVWTKANTFRGKRKMEYQWDEVEYEIAHQVTNGLSSYETKYWSGKV